MLEILHKYFNTAKCREEKWNLELSRTSLGSLIYTDFSTCCNKEKHLVRTLIITLINNKFIFERTYHKPDLFMEISNKTTNFQLSAFKNAII